MIEPLVEMEPHLEQTCRKLGNARYYLNGAGAEPGELTFTIWPTLSGSSFIPQPDQPGYESHEKRKV
ncbi:MAG: hypothetical protein BWZ08_01220 [candidate division BRC1 bacterium ADurb.BinA292]|nr:MAG: hypothetical protein BWZ08_01220 [candidate division BRC1 bacterium ADurb.BinA292]